MSLSSSPIRSALVAQLLGGITAAVLLHFAYPQWPEEPLTAAVLQGACAALIGNWLGAPKWWLAIHCSFLPAMVLASRLELAPGWYSAAFVLLLLIYWRTDKSRVPLYLSNATTAAALVQLLPSGPCRVVDLGCGQGGLLLRLARARGDCQFVGIEHAPLPWLWARLTSLGQANLQIIYGDFWQQHLASFDIVYAFLSPHPMPRLMAKARAEMRSGTLLVSNSFALPGTAAERVVAVADRRATQLHCYRI
ncbi:MAG: methyltransferase domain-containing protein [Proteobacteria bacterium]|nr:methyltransferase domain-containing protein [Pseudomonadota bacterium]